jgi:urease accessory protein
LLAFERRGGRTILTERRFTLPLQALEPIALDGDSSLCLMILNPTGGLVGGDHLTTEITLGVGTHVCLTTPSATKVYRSLGPPAVQETTIVLGAGAILEYLPDHVIPHPGSALHQTVTMEMGRQSRVILLDAFAVGRLARGERWDFRELVNRMTITREGRPLFLERTRLDAGKQRFAGLGGMEGFGYVATLGCFGDGVEDWEHMARSLDEQLKGIGSVLGGVSPISRSGVIVRFLAPSASDLTEATRSLWALARRLLLGLPAVDMRKW